MEKEHCNILNCIAFAGWFGPKKPALEKLSIDGRHFNFYEIENGGFYTFGAQEQTKDAPFIVVSGRPWGDLYKAVFSKDALGLGKIDGKFALAAIENKHVLLATDILCGGGVYYCEYENTLYFSDHLGILLKISSAPKNISDLGVASILLSQCQLMPQSHVEGHYKLGAGQKLEAHGTPLKVNISTYLCPAEALSSGEEALRDTEHLDALLEASISREGLNHEDAITLSGGRDSQALALVCGPCGWPALTYGSRWSSDMMWAKKFARAAKMKHHVVPYEEWGYGTYANLIIESHGGAMGLQIAQNLVGFDWLGESNFRSAIVGHLGDPITGSHLGDKEDVPVQQLIRTTIPNRHPWDVDLESIFEKEILILENWIYEEKKKLSGLTSSQIHRIIDITTRQAAWISNMFTTCSWFVPLRYPFFYRPLLQALFKADFEKLKGQALYENWYTVRKKKCGIIYEKSNFSSSLYSFPSRLLKGCWPPERTYWKDVQARSRSYLNKHNKPCGVETIDKVNHYSFEAAKQHKVNHFPTYVFGLALSEAIKKL